MQIIELLSELLKKKIPELFGFKLSKNSVSLEELKFILSIVTLNFG